MRCPYCGELQNRVIDSRMARDGRAIRRRRHCEACSERFTTYEVIEEALADVEKRTGHTEPFDADKLVRSLRLACKKRPVALPTLTGFVDRLQGRIAARPRKVVTSQEIGEAVLAFLRELDPVAYVRYASVYRSFQTITEFTRELDTFAAAEALGIATPAGSGLVEDAEGDDPRFAAGLDDLDGRSPGGPEPGDLGDADEQDLSELTGLSRGELEALLGSGRGEPGA